MRPLMKIKGTSNNSHDMSKPMHCRNPFPLPDRLELAGALDPQALNVAKNSIS